MNPACLTAFAASTRPTTPVAAPAPTSEQQATSTKIPKIIMQTITPYIPWFARAKDEPTTSLRGGIGQAAWSDAEYLQSQDAGVSGGHPAVEREN